LSNKSNYEEKTKLGLMVTGDGTDLHASDYDALIGPMRTEGLSNEFVY